MHREDVMMSRVSLVAAAFALLTTTGLAQSPASLTGQVSSTEEGPMEGVLVTAKKAGSTIAITVVSDKDGHYSFPAGRLDAGQYGLRIRAIGYELESRTAADITADRPAAVDLRLRKATDVSSQLTNAEWLESMPGPDVQKASLSQCVNCHTLERVVRSKYDAGGFQQILARMANYSSQSFFLKPQLRTAERPRQGDPAERVQEARKRLTEYLASVNLSENSSWDYSLKRFPRPSGRGTRVIITEYDLPRATIEPHDVIVNHDGNAWYSNFGELNIGKLDPKTGKVTEYPMPEQKKGVPTGSLSIRADRDGNLWLGTMNQAAIAKFDPKTETFKFFPMPPDYNKDWTQINMVRPEHSHVDGKVWAQDNATATLFRLDPATGKFDIFEPFKGMKESHNPYDVVPDLQNNAYFTDFSQEHIGHVDAATGKATLYKTPSPRTTPRRGMVDEHDRFWFAEYRGNRIGMFDPKTAQIKEWLAPTPWSNPYDVVADKNGDVWTGSMLSDRVLRLDPATDRFTEYLLPRTTNIRRVFVDNSTTPVTFWVGNNHGASIVKLEPLD
jgi:virginiamycin B lyase